MEESKSAVVLLVEDDPGDQKLIKYALGTQHLNHGLRIVGTGEEALEYLANCQKAMAGYEWPDLILLDLNMPGMGGKEFLRCIKADPQLCELPVVIVSTSDAESDIEETYKLHAAGYVQKSASPDELKRVIQKLVKYWFATSSLVAKQ
ncbi:MAG: response regulator [Phycisphaerae bacterium]